MRLSIATPESQNGKVPSSTARGWQWRASWDPRRTQMRRCGLAGPAAANQADAATQSGPGRARAAASRAAAAAG